MPLLQLKRWNPTANISDIMSEIKKLIEKYGSVNPKNPVNQLKCKLPPFTGN